MYVLFNSFLKEITLQRKQVTASTKMLLKIDHETTKSACRGLSRDQTNTYYNV